MTRTTAAGAVLRGFATEYPVQTLLLAGVIVTGAWTLVDHATQGGNGTSAEAHVAAYSVSDTSTSGGNGPSESPTTTQGVVTTLAPPTLDLSPQVSLACPPFDQGPWDWYEAAFTPTVGLASEFRSASIRYGDGRTYESSTWDDAQRNMFWHRYQEPGSFTVTVSVTDAAGRVGSGSCDFGWNDTRGPSASGCDLNYSGGCVPIASDVDCAGGSGNGPAFVWGPVYVVGVDVYGLDRDHDGVGCE